MPLVRLTPIKPHQASPSPLNGDPDADFKTSLRANLAELEASLTNLHESELNSLQSDNAEMKRELMKLKIETVPNTAREATHEPEVKPPKDNTSSAYSEAVVITAHEDRPGHNRHIHGGELCASQNLLTLYPHLPSNMEVADAADHMENSLHFYMKKIWLTLVEEGLQKTTLASFQSLTVTPQRTRSGYSTSTSFDLFEEDAAKYAGLEIPRCPWVVRCNRSLAKFMMYPSSRKRLAWAFFTLLFLGYDLFMIPYSLSFKVDSTSFDDVVAVSCCLFWTMDILMTTFTGSYFDFHLIMDPVIVFLQYAKGWLAFDLCLVLVDWVILVFEVFESASFFSMFRGVRLVRVGRMLRIARVARVAKLKAILTEILVVTPDAVYGILRLAKAFIIIISFVHFGACGWAAVGRIDGGWIQASSLDESNTRYNYAVAVHWISSTLQGSRSSLVIAHGTSELYIDSAFLICGFVLTAFFVATITFAVFSNSESETVKIHRMATRYLKAHDCSAKLKMKTHKFLQSRSLDGPAELLAYEVQLFRAFPSRLQEDLKYEARAPKLRKSSAFATLHCLSSRCVRQLCNEMYDKLVAEGESLFSKGDSCNQMYMVRDGCFKYNCEEEVLVQTPRQRSFPRTPDSIPGCDILGKGQCLCEAAFWTDWENAGELVALDQFGLLLIFDADKFAHIVMLYRVGRVHASKYSHHFVRRLNHCHSCDLTSFDFDIGELDIPAYSGTPEDHFAFISHYKVEAGTEATLMRDLMLSILKTHITHEANDYMSAIFVDSEDLVDLTRLRAHVEGSCNILLLLTPNLLERPWCLLECVTAIRSNVPIVPVEIQRPGLKYIYPNEDWYTSLRRGEVLSRDSVQLLLGMGVTLEEVEGTIRQIFMMIALPFSPHKSGTIRAAEITDIMKRCQLRQSLANASVGIEAS